MTTLKFADTHNMVAFLSKPKESDGFEQRVDFLNTHPVKYALTVNLIIFTSCIEQFWSTIKTKTVNGEVQLQALVDGKKIIVTEAFRAEQDNGNILKTRSKATPNEPSSPGTSSGGGPKRQETIGDTLVFAKTRSEKDVKLRVKKLEKKGGSRTYKLKRLYKVGRSARVISSDEVSLGDQEDASKQGRKIDDIDKDAEITLVHETQRRYGDEEMFDTSVLDGDEMLAEPEVTDKDVNLSVDEVTLAQALAALKNCKIVSTRPKAKGLVIHEEEQATTLTVSLQQPSQLNVQDKRKEIMVEEPVKMNKKDQIGLDEEIAFKLQAKEEEEERLVREKAQREEEANIGSWDNVQAMIDADY
ncbi:hypothetical protein Tco_0681999 [Tanacetum coccineum]|uniref:Xylulose kinase-1 n=1 Tax=Tanacetum coccineum TaxID=301880 RepID=A0ABQ4XRI7_9ASTR